MLVILKEGIVWEKSSCRDKKGKIGEDQEGKGKGVQVGEDKTWTRVHGPPVMDRVHGQFFLITRNEQKQK